MILILGKNGSGKTYLSKGLENIGFKRSISYTTRPKRPKEHDDKDYVFITKEEFEERIRRNEFIEYKSFRNYYYGTPKSNMINSDIILSGGKINPVILPYVDHIYYIDCPLMIRYKSLLKRNSSNSELFDRLHGENIDYLFDYNAKIFTNLQDNTIVSRVYKSILDDELVKEIPFKLFLEECVSKYHDIEDYGLLLRFVDFEEYIIRRLYLEGRLTSEEYEEEIRRFLVNNHYSFIEEDNQYIIDFDNEQTICKKLVKSNGS